MKVGRFRERVNITTDHEKAGKINVYVFGEVIGNIKVQPNYVSLGTLKKGKAVEKTIKVNATGDTPFKILDVSSSEKEIKTALETVKEGKEYLVKLILPETYTRPLAKGTVTIKTDDKEQEEIQVRFFGRSHVQRKKTKPPEKKPKK